MSANKKTKHTKVQKTAAKLKKNDPHIEMNDKEMSDPFSFGLNAVKQTVKAGNEFKKTVEKELSKGAGFKNFMNQNVASGVKENMDKYLNSTSNSIFNNTEATNAGNVFAERVINSFTSTLSSAIEKNTALSQEMLKCKDAKDCMSFQQKLFEVNVIFHSGVQQIVG